MENKRNFKGIWIPREIWLSQELTLQEKVFLVEIDSLDNDRGCFASNKHFSDFFGLTKGRCSQIIKSLEDKGYTKISYTYRSNSKEIKERVIRVGAKYPKGGIKKIKGGVKYPKEGYLENAQDNNTSLNNTSNNKESNVFEDDIYRLATLLSELHIQNIDKGFKPLSKSQRDRWAKDIDKLHRIDGRSYQDIEKAIRTIKKNGQFWGTVVMSGSKLREKFPTIWAQINQAGYSKPLPVQTRTAFLDMED